MGLFGKIKEGLTKTKQAFSEKVDTVIKNFRKVDEELLEELEEALIAADVGIATSVDIIDNLRDIAKSRKIESADELKETLKEIISEMMKEKTSGENTGEMEIIMVIGVNGAGKTTSIGKLANKFKNDGKNVIMAAADTFRAAAIEQLEVWSQRCGVDIIKQGEGADPAAVVYDAVTAAKNRGADVLIIDTAGRLHNKKNLMEELRKMHKILEREAPKAKKEVYLVLDATTGQNALSQAKLFGEVTDITGIVLTKLDGTAKGGVVIAISHEQNIPVKYVGVGEGIDNLLDFSPEEFVNELFDE